MIALPSPSPSQPLFPTLAWSFESPYQHHESTQTFVLGDFNDHASTSHDLLQLPQQMFDAIPSSSTTPDISSNYNSSVVVKKLHHNASERDRRKKMNGLYSSLRSLLPVPDQMKKLSIPSTVARVVKYIPELQQEVHKLITKKEKLSSKIAKQELHDNLKIHQQNQPKQTKNASISTISLNRLGNGDVVIQIPAQKGQDCPLMSELLLNLEEEGLILLNASSLETSGGTLLFYNLHFKVKENYKLDREKMITMLGKKDRVFPRDVGTMQQLVHH